MQYIDLTFPTPQQNLACDEALVALCEGGYEHEILRVWEPREHFVVLGYSNRVFSEVDVSACQQNLIPIFRRCSGGGAVLQGPGCLNYALILGISNRDPLANISATNAFVMQRHQQAIQNIIAFRVEIQGFTDLALRDLKFSGNAQYRRRRFLLFHGTFLLRFDIASMERTLCTPQRQPAYRRGRSHRDFLINLDVDAATVKHALCETWEATTPLPELPLTDIERLAEEKYSRRDWNFRF
ncbi:MAG: lipoate--protein ligase family protein [Deltaproteobacteria bacterium]|nr:lipoate--protein ligase family protein [Deltaproteobacteria bacterium]